MSGKDEAKPVARFGPMGIYVHFSVYEDLLAEAERLRNPVSHAQSNAIRDLILHVDAGGTTISAEQWQAVCALFREQDAIIRARGDMIEQATASAEAAEAAKEKLVSAIKERYEFYYRQGPDYETNGEAFIYAAFLEDLHDAALSEGSGE